MSRCRYAVFGAGAVGGFFAAALARSGFWVGIIARGEQLTAIQSSGLHVELPDGEFHVRPATSASNSQEIGPVDAVILAVKAWQVPEAACQLQAMLGPTTKVLPIQNGVEAAAQLRQVLDRDHVLDGSCRIVCERVSPGRIRHVAVGPEVTFGEADDADLSPTSRALAAALSKSGIAVRTPPYMQIALWEKMLYVTPVSAVASIARASAGEIRHCEATYDLLRRAMREVAAVAIASGIHLSDDAISQCLTLFTALPDHATVSMQRDILAGRPSELEAIVGTVVRYGRQNGVATPVLELIHAALLPQEHRARHL